MKKINETISNDTILKACDTNYKGKRKQEEKANYYHIAILYSNQHTVKLFIYCMN